jgi:hypothetical protein
MIWIPLRKVRRYDLVLRVQCVAMIASGRITSCAPVHDLGGTIRSQALPATLEVTCASEAAGRKRDEARLSPLRDVRVGFCGASFQRD